MTARWNFASYWEAIAEVIPEHGAQSHDGAVVSWQAFDHHANGLARTLLDAGLGVQEKVALFLYNGPAYMQTVFAALKAALVPVNTNYRYRGEELAYLWDNSDAAVVVFQGSLTERVAAVRSRCPGVRLWIQVNDGTSDCPDWALDWDKASHPSALRVLPPWGRGGDDLLLIYTGGTTGLPRGVMWAQHELFLASNTTDDPPDADYAAVQRRLERARAAGKPAPIGLPAAPLMHGTAFVFAATVLNRGGTVATLKDHRFDALRLLDTISSEGVTDLCFVGDAFCQPIVEALDAEPQRWSIRSLRAVSSSGMAWSATGKARLLKHAPDALLIDFLNSSEASGMGRSIASRDRSPDSARFRLGERAIVLDEELRPVAPGSGVVGRIAVRGRIPLGYYKDPERTRQVFPVIDGERISLPGDFATVEADGSIRLLGRGSVSINTGGEKVFPDEVEAALRAVPGIRDALVVGIPDARLGERVAALIEPSVNATIPSVGDLQAFLGERLARYKIPRLFVPVESIGRGPNGKASYPEARQRAVEFEAAMRAGHDINAQSAALSANGNP